MGGSEEVHVYIGSERGETMNTLVSASENVMTHSTFLRDSSCPRELAHIFP